MEQQQTLNFDKAEKERRKGQRQKCLEALMEGPKTNKQLSEMGLLRYGAYVGDLNKRGHRITCRPGTTVGEFVYAYDGYEERQRTKPTDQELYYKTPHWQRKRLERMEFDGHRCCHCRATTELTVHHWHYDLFNEDIEDLVTLCRTCHWRIHAYPSVQVCFPDWLRPDVIARIRRGGINDV